MYSIFNKKASPDKVKSEGKSDSKGPALTKQQERCIEAVVNGVSQIANRLQSSFCTHVGKTGVCFTGSGGTGKSFLIQHLIKALPASTTFVTATTGLAAFAVKVNGAGLQDSDLLSTGYNNLQLCWYRFGRRETKGIACKVRQVAFRCLTPARSQGAGECECAEAVEE